MANKYKIILAVGLLPFMFVLIVGIISFFDGYTFFFHTTYGVQAFIDVVVILSYILWPLYLIGLLLIIYAIIKSKKQK